MTLYLFLSNIQSGCRYAGRGCSTQVDQDQFAILHSSKEIPIPLEKETGMVLGPIRMKPEHPSTALPTSSRIHFGRAYAIDHDVPVKSLGLVHAESIQRLVLESAAHVRKKDLGNNSPTLESRYLSTTRELVEKDLMEKELSDLDKDIVPADMEVVKDIRYSIKDVLGGNLSLNKHSPPAAPLLGLSTALSEGAMDSKSSRETKRSRIS
jgi:hypothetical protein